MRPFELSWTEVIGNYYLWAGHPLEFANSNVCHNGRNITEKWNLGWSSHSSRLNPHSLRNAEWHKGEFLAGTFICLYRCVYRLLQQLPVVNRYDYNPLDVYCWPCLRLRLDPAIPRLLWEFRKQGGLFWTLWLKRSSLEPVFLQLGIVCLQLHLDSVRNLEGSLNLMTQWEYLPYPFHLQYLYK